MPLKTSPTRPVKWLRSDNQFNHLYPASIKKLARRHWTPIEVARKAASFLAVENGVKILDIGSGVGKFCLAAALLHPQAHLFGIEQRKNLLAHAETAKSILAVPNVSFIHGSFTQLKLNHYNHFYFYNSFQENLPGNYKIDNRIALSPNLYNYYNSNLFSQLEQMPAGTRLATYHCPEEEAPKTFLITGTEMDGLLKFWVKV